MHSVNSAYCTSGVVHSSNWTSYLQATSIIDAGIHQSSKKAFLFANKYSSVLVTTQSKTALLSCFTWNLPSEQTTVTISFYFLCWSFKTSTKEITNIRHLHTRHRQNVIKRTSYFDSEICSYHAVPGCQVSVDKLLGIKVSHAVCDLSSHLDHLFQSGWRTPRIVLWDMRQIFIFWSANTEIHFYFMSTTHDLALVFIPKHSCFRQQ